MLVLFSFIQSPLALCLTSIRCYIKTGKFKYKVDLTKVMLQAREECGCKSRSLEGRSNAVYQTTTKEPLSSSNLLVYLNKKRVYNN